jgi:hypothetical protein
MALLKNARQRKAVMTKLNSRDKELFDSCSGYCKPCFDEGGCVLEKKLKKRGYVYKDTYKYSGYNPADGYGR